MSPFFLDHGYHVEPLDFDTDPREFGNPRTPAQKAENIVAKLKEALEMAQASMASAQQAQEEYANHRRDPAREYQVGDKIWLDLRNVRTERPSKKLDIHNAQYTVLEKVGSHAYKFNIPEGTIHPVFHTTLLRVGPIPANSAIGL
jgi:hypothetical protein